MTRLSLLGIAGVVVVLLGALAFLSGVGQYQASQQFDGDIADDRNRRAQLNATSGFEVCAYDNGTRSLTCPENPYSGSLPWIVGGVVALAVGGGAVYVDLEGPPSR